MAVLLSQADIQRIVSRPLQRDATRQVQPSVRVLIGQAEHANAAANAAGLKDQIIQADIRDGDLACDQSGVDAQRALPGIGEPSVKPAKPASGQRFP